MKTAEEYKNKDGRYTRANMPFEKTVQVIKPTNMETIVIVNGIYSKIHGDTVSKDQLCSIACIQQPQPITIYRDNNDLPEWSLAVEFKVKNHDRFSIIRNFVGV